MKTRTLCTWIAALGVISLPVWAQTAPGPVHVPSGYATNSTVIAPASSLTAPPPPTNAPPVVAPANPAPGAASSTDDDGDIRDIRGVVTPPNSLAWVYYAVGGVALAALLYFAWRWLRRTVIKPKLAHEIALERLEAARALMTETQVREYAFAVSEVIRTYIEKRFGERAARRTTEEFLSDLVKQTGTPLAEHRALLEDFLRHCDLPKFARWQLSVREMESMHESARVFIFDTRPGAAAHAPVPAQPEPVPVP
jgi:HAMP domain-containing protein